MENALTVIIPVYNGMPYLKEAVESILRQTYTDFHLLIVNDGSKDGTAAYLDSLSDPRLDVRHQTNMGQNETTNRAVASLTSEFMALLDADDVALPARLGKQIGFLLSHPDYGGVLSNYVRLVGNKEIRLRGLDGDSEFIDYRSEKFGVIPPSTFCGRRKAWLELGGYRTSLGITGDYDFLLRLEEKHKIAVLTESLVRYRLHANTSSFHTSTRYAQQARYAEAMASRRRAGKDEISAEEFWEIEKREPAVLRWRKRMDGLGRAKLRKAAAMLGEGRVFACAWNLVGALLLAPRYAAGKLLALRR